MISKRALFLALVSLGLLLSAGGAWAVEADADGDGVGNYKDNCSLANPDQKDTDGDFEGDVCDTDDDNDGRPDGSDNCPLVSNPGQEDSDADGIGDACDPTTADPDSDGIGNNLDNCPNDPNPGQEDMDGDGIGDVCDNDVDGDQVKNTLDNCPNVPNADQYDLDNDDIGAACDPDDDPDRDGLLASPDNCDFTFNPDQLDSNNNGTGDACDPADEDQDGLIDADEVAGAVATQTNPNDRDTDHDGIWDGVDENPTMPDSTYGGCVSWANDPERLSNPASNNIIFVDPCSTGTGSPNQTSTAVRTLKEASSIWKNGNTAYTVYMRGRLHYVESFELPEYAQKVTITSYPGEQAVLTSMVCARNWKYAYTRTEKDATGTLREYDVYKKRFMKHYISVSHKWRDAQGVDHVTALAGDSGSFYRVPKESIRYFGEDKGYPVGEYYAQSSSFEGSYPYPNDVASDPTTTLYICLPGGQGRDPNPDAANSVVLVSPQGCMIMLYDQASYIFDELRFTRAGTAFDLQAGTVEIKNCTFDDMQSHAIYAGKNPVVKVNKCKFDRIGSTGWDHGMYMFDLTGEYWENEFNYVSGAAIKLCGKGTHAYSNLIGPALPAVYGPAERSRLGFVDAQNDTAEQMNERGANYVYNNVVFGSHSTGVFTWCCNGSKYFNNVFYGIENCGLNAESNHIAGVQFQNNILVAASNPASDFKMVKLLAGGTDPATYNLYYGSLGGYVPDANSIAGQDPQFVDPANNDFHLQCSSPAIDEGDSTVVSSVSSLVSSLPPETKPVGPNVQADLDGKMRVFRQVDMGAYEEPIYVDDDATAEGTGTCLAPFQKIQTGVDAGADRALVLVREGVYSGPRNNNIDFGGRNITLQSTAGPTVTIIDGIGTPNVRGFYFQTQEQSAVLDGFTIQNMVCEWGAGIRIDGSSSPTIRNCIVTNNTSATSTGAGIYCPPPSQSNLKLENCVVSNNTASYGAGIRFEGASLSLRNCTVVGNSATNINGDGHGLYTGGANVSVTVTNSIFWNSATPRISEIYAPNSLTTVTASFSDIQGGFGTGNINSPPNLNGYHLVTGSPCIDTGDNDSADGIESDIDEDARIIGDTVDMGADEFQP